MAQDLLIAGKIAKEWGVAQKDVKKTIEKLGLQPDLYLLHQRNRRKN